MMNDLTLNPSAFDSPHPKSLSRGERDFKTYFNSVLQTTPLLPREKGPGDEALQSRGRGMRLFAQGAGG